MGTMATTTATPPLSAQSPASEPVSSPSPSPLPSSSSPPASNPTEPREACSQDTVAYVSIPTEVASTPTAKPASVRPKSSQSQNADVIPTHFAAHPPITSNSGFSPQSATPASAPVPTPAPIPITVPVPVPVPGAHQAHQQAQHASHGSLPEAQNEGYVPENLQPRNHFMPQYTITRHSDVIKAREAEAKRTSEAIVAAAQRAQEEGYTNWRRRAMLENGEDVRTPHTFRRRARTPPPRDDPLTPAEVKEEQLRLLKLLRDLSPALVVDQICKGLAFFGGIPSAPPPEDGIFPESYEANGSGGLFVGWLAEIFPDLSKPPRRRRPGRPKGSKLKHPRSDKGSTKGPMNPTVRAAVLARRGARNGIQPAHGQAGLEDDQGTDDGWVDVDEGIRQLGALLRQGDDGGPQGPNDDPESGAARRRGHPRASRNRAQDAPTPLNGRDNRPAPEVPAIIHPGLSLSSITRLPSWSKGSKHRAKMNEDGRAEAPSTSQHTDNEVSDSQATAGNSQPTSSTTSATTSQAQPRHSLPSAGTTSVTAQEPGDPSTIVAKRKRTSQAGEDDNLTDTAALSDAAQQPAARVQTDDAEPPVAKRARKSRARAKVSEEQSSSNPAPTRPGLVGGQEAFSGTGSCPAAATSSLGLNDHGSLTINGVEVDMKELGAQIEQHVSSMQQPQPPHNQASQRQAAEQAISQGSPRTTQNSGRPDAQQGRRNQQQPYYSRPLPTASQYNQASSQHQPQHQPPQFPPGPRNALRGPGMQTLDLNMPNTQGVQEPRSYNETGDMYDTQDSNHNSRNRGAMNMSSSAAFSMSNADLAQIVNSAGRPQYPNASGQVRQGFGWQ